MEQLRNEPIEANEHAREITPVAIHELTEAAKNLEATTTPRAHTLDLTAVFVAAFDVNRRPQASEHGIPLIED